MVRKDNLSGHAYIISMISFTIFGVLALTPARADWQYTRWGMTLTQVITAAKGEAVPAPSSAVCAFTDQRPIAFIRRKMIDASAFEVVLCSGNDGRLSSVVLTPKPEEGSFISLRSALVSRYGSPIEDESGDIAITTWRDERAGNLVRLLKVMSQGRIEYRVMARGL